jgi:hypothetical protein
LKHVDETRKWWVDSIEPRMAEKWEQKDGQDGQPHMQEWVEEEVKNKEGAFN